MPAASSRTRYEPTHSPGAGHKCHLGKWWQVVVKALIWVFPIVLSAVVWVVTKIHGQENTHVLVIKEIQVLRRDVDAVTELARKNAEKSYYMDVIDEKLSGLTRGMDEIKRDVREVKNKL